MIKYFACLRQPRLSVGSSSTGGRLSRVRYLFRTVSQFVLELTAAGISSGVGDGDGTAATYSAGPLTDAIASGTAVASGAVLGGGGGGSDPVVSGSVAGGAA